MDDEQRTAIEQECRDLILAITQHGDHGDADAATALFADDATWFRGGKLRTGLAEIRDSYGHGPATQVTRHFNGGTVVTVTDDDHAEAVTYYLALSHDPGPDAGTGPLPLRPFSAGEWHDSFVRTPAGWRFASRATKRIFQREEG